MSPTLAKPQFGFVTIRSVVTNYSSHLFVAAIASFPTSFRRFKSEDRAAEIKHIETELQIREAHRLAAKGIKRSSAAA